ncbi:MAG: hypothetical protein EA359_10115 [Balneolaceae bacterium]|nr:MAG: hypothetical protein EA359_10115 [Balneolaceae bacterium]
MTNTLRWSLPTITPLPLELLLYFSIFRHSGLVFAALYPQVPLLNSPLKRGAKGGVKCEAINAPPGVTISLAPSGAFDHRPQGLHYSSFPVLCPVPAKIFYLDLSPLI